MPFLDRRSPRLSARKPAHHRDGSIHLHLETEVPGQLLPLDTHEIISCRYQFAAQLARDKRVLEVGSGPGLGLALLSRHARFLVAAEFSGENLDIALRHYGGNQRLVHADAHSLPFAECSFDLIVAMAMIYYLDMDLFLEEVKRVLEPGGRFFFCTSNKDVPGFVPAPYTTRYFSIPQLRDKLMARGMRGNFYGVFAASGSLLRRQLWATIKEVAKPVINRLPGGGELWSRLRASSLGPHELLPVEIEEQEGVNIKPTELSPNQVNRTYRVVYVIAKPYVDGL